MSEKRSVGGSGSGRVLCVKEAFEQRTMDREGC